MVRQRSVSLFVSPPLPAAAETPRAARRCGGSRAERGARTNISPDKTKPTALRAGGRRNRRGGRRMRRAGREAAAENGRQVKPTPRRGGPALLCGSPHVILHRRRLPVRRV